MQKKRIEGLSNFRTVRRARCLWGTNTENQGKGEIRRASRLSGHVTREQNLLHKTKGTGHYFLTKPFKTTHSFFPNAATTPPQPTIQKADMRGRRRAKTLGKGGGENDLRTRKVRRVRLSQLVESARGRPQTRDA